MSRSVSFARDYQRPAFERSRTSFSRPLPELEYDRPTASPALDLAQFIDRSLKTIGLRGTDKLCLLIPAHNEELVIAKTIKSAIASGMNRKDIYVVDDNSVDMTSEIARSLIGKYNVLSVGRSGKGVAIQKAAKAFNLSKRYQWIHIADADGVFDAHYFTTFKQELKSNHAAATGYLMSSPGSYIGKSRVVEYTMVMELTRRVQTQFHVLHMMPGASSCIRADVFDKLNFDCGIVTEDFDVTMQIHRQGLGQIQFIPNAIAYTQDPGSMKDMITQVTRWYEGGFEVIRKYRIGYHFTRIDFFIILQFLQYVSFVAISLVMIPALIIVNHSLYPIAMLFIWDVLILALTVFITAARAKRFDIFGAFPVIYMLKWVNNIIFLKVFIKSLFNHRREEGVLWESVARQA